ncbi:ribbon-helix-helix domain-containing protein [Geoglobus ahangari]
MAEIEIYNVSVKLTKKEAEEFDNAIKKHGKFLNRSDAIRNLIREFIEAVNRADKAVLIDTDSDAEILEEADD